MSLKYEPASEPLQVGVPRNLSVKLIKKWDHPKKGMVTFAMVPWDVKNNIVGPLNPKNNIVGPPKKRESYLLTTYWSESTLSSR